jgi:hypothetical protein
MHGNIHQLVSFSQKKIITRKTSDMIVISYMFSAEKKNSMRKELLFRKELVEHQTLSSFYGCYISEDGVPSTFNPPILYSSTPLFNSFGGGAGPSNQLSYWSTTNI